MYNLILTDLKSSSESLAEKIGRKKKGIFFGKMEMLVVIICEVFFFSTLKARN